MLGNGPHVLGIMSHWGLCRIRYYVAFGVMSFGIVSFDVMSFGLLSVYPFFIASMFYLKFLSKSVRAIK